MEADSRKQVQPMGREFELKYGLNAGAKAEIAKNYAPFHEITMRTTYYDTPTGALGKLRYTLRARLENGVCVCTLKTPLPDGSKGEWETVCDDIFAAVPKLIALGAPTDLALLTAEGLAPICGAAFLRMAADVQFGESRLELALDEGILFRGDAETALLELEVELKTGQDTDAVAFAEKLSRKYGLSPEPKSKFKRAKEL